MIRPVFKTLCVVLSLLILTACAGLQSYKEGYALLDQGKAEQGLSKLEEAVKLAPKNAEYRIALANQRAAVIQRWLRLAELDVREGRLSEAEKTYLRVQGLEADNVMARQGLQAVVKARQHQHSVDQAREWFKKGGAAEQADALEKLRPVLTENPAHQDALHLKAQIDEARAKAQRSELKLAASFRKPISLEFRDAPLKTVIELIAKVSGLNFFYDKDIRPDLRATVFAQNTTIDDALRLVLVTNQLEQKILSDNAVLIYPSTPQKLKDYQTLAVRTFYVTNADVKAVANSLKTIVKSKDLVMDERLGIIMLRDTPEAIRMAERIVALQDLSDPEVMLDVEILEIKRSRLLELGIQWPSQLTLSPLQVDGLPLTLDALRRLGRTTTQATVGSLVINARKEDQDGNILANPRIRVRNKEKAKVQIGDRVPVITTTSTSTGFVSESVNYVDVGLKLEVEPTIYLDGDVAIKINLEVSNLVREVLSKAGSLSYQIGTRGANTVLRLKDGETQILAGLISNEDRSTANKVPLLSELPIAGRLFGSQKDDTQRSEILLSITPRIVRAVQRPDMLSAEFESGTESSMGAPSLRLSKADASVAEEPQAPVGSIPNKPENAPNALLTAPPAALPPAPPASAATSAYAAASATSSGPAPTTPSAPTGLPTRLDWQAPAQVKVGEQFSAVLSLSTSSAVRAMPVLLGFDPRALQVLGVEEGAFFKQGGTPTRFSQRLDLAQGKVFAALLRQGAGGTEAGINGQGSVLTLRLKALKPGQTLLRVLSASPDPAPAEVNAGLISQKAIQVLP
jgi:general secretion pathway protein D